MKRLIIVFSINLGTIGVAKEDFIDEFFGDGLLTWRDSLDLTGFLDRVPVGSFGMELN